MISLGLLPCFPIRIALVIEADTPIYWLNKVVRFWMSSFFWHVLLLSLIQEHYVQSGFVSSFSSNMMSAVIEAVDLTDKECLLESRVESSCLGGLLLTVETLFKSSTSWEFN